MPLLETFEELRTQTKVQNRRRWFCKQTYVLYIVIRVIVLTIFERSALELNYCTAQVGP